MNGLELKRLTKYLVGETMDAMPITPVDLQKHDAARHGGHYDPQTQSCKYREDHGILQAPAVTSPEPNPDNDKADSGVSSTIRNGVKAHAAVKEDAPKPGQKQFFHPSVTADIIPVRKNPETGKYEVLLIKRKDNVKAYPGAWAVPGGFIDEDDESAAHAAARELKEETGIGNPRLKFIGAWNKKGRDPRGPVFSHAYLAELPYEQTVKETQAGDDAKQTSWLPISIDSSNGGHTVHLGDAESGVSFSCKSQEDEFGQPEYDMEDNDLAFDHANILAHALLDDDRFRS